MLNSFDEILPSNLNVHFLQESELFSCREPIWNNQIFLMDAGGNKYSYTWLVCIHTSVVEILVFNFIRHVIYYKFNLLFKTTLG